MVQVSFFPTKSYKRIETLNGGLRWLLALFEKVSKFRPYMFSIFICLKLALYVILEAIQKPTRVYIFFLTDIGIKTLKFKIKRRYASFVDASQNQLHILQWHIQSN